MVLCLLAISILIVNTGSFSGKVGQQNGYLQCGRYSGKAGWLSLRRYFISVA
jgi:hypothetical protein